MVATLQAERGISTMLVPSDRVSRRARVTPVAVLTGFTRDATRVFYSFTQAKVPFPVREVKYKTRNRQRLCPIYDIHDFAEN